MLPAILVRFPASLATALISTTKSETRDFLFEEAPDESFVSSATRSCARWPKVDLFEDDFDPITFIQFFEVDCSLRGMNPSARVRG